MYRESVSPHVSTALSPNISSPQGCVLCPLLYTPTRYQSHFIYCGAHLLRTSLEILHTPKTKELTVGFNRNKTDLHPIYLDGNCGERVLSFMFLGVHMDQWSSNTTVVMKKALRRINPDRELLIESVILYNNNILFYLIKTILFDAK